MTLKFEGDWSVLVSQIEEAAHANAPLEIVISEADYQRLKETEMRELWEKLSANAFIRLCLLESYPVCDPTDGSITELPIVLVAHLGRCP